MKEAIIVDTSIWIDFFKAAENIQVLTLVEYIENELSCFKSNDCLTAQYALKNTLTILHKDRDFDMIFKHFY